jgi:hypothetical protein
VWIAAGRAYFCPRDSSIEVLEWLLAWPAFGISFDSCDLDKPPVGLLAEVSCAVGPDVDADEEVVLPLGVDCVVALEELLVAGAFASGAAGVTTVVEDEALGVGTVWTTGGLLAGGVTTTGGVGASVFCWHAASITAAAHSAIGSERFMASPSKLLCGHAAREACSCWHDGARCASGRVSEP